MKAMKAPASQSKPDKPKPKAKVDKTPPESPVKRKADGDADRTSSPTKPRFLSTAEDQALKTKRTKDLRGWLQFQGRKDTPEVIEEKKKSLVVFDNFSREEKNSFLEKWAGTSCKKDLGFFKEYSTDVNKNKDISVDEEIVVWTRLGPHCYGMHFLAISISSLLSVCAHPHC